MRKISLHYLNTCKISFQWINFRLILLSYEVFVLNFLANVFLFLKVQFLILFRNTVFSVMNISFNNHNSLDFQSHSFRRCEKRKAYA
jgi:hypothetical protein